MLFISAHNAVPQELAPSAAANCRPASVWNTLSVTALIKLQNYAF